MLFCSLYVGMSIAFGSPGGAALFTAGIGLSGAIIYGGYAVASMKVPTFRVWTKREAKLLIQEYNRGLLLHVRRRAFPVRVRFAIKSNGVGLVGKF